MYGSNESFEFGPTPEITAGSRIAEGAINATQEAVSFIASFLTLGAVALETPSPFTHQSARMAFALEAVPVIEPTPRPLAVAPHLGGLSLADAHRGLNLPFAA